MIIYYDELVNIYDGQMRTEKVGCEKLHISIKKCII